MRSFTFLCSMLLSIGLLMAQPASVWRGVTPDIPDTVGCQALKAVDAQVAWALSQKYNPDDSLYYYAGAPATWFHRSTDGGQTWSADTAPDIGDAPYLLGVTALDANRAWINGLDFNTFETYAFQTSDGGQTWTRILDSLFNTPGGFLNSVYFWDDLRGIAMGDASQSATDTVFHYEIHHTIDGGQTWTRLPRTSALEPLQDEYGSTYRVRGNQVWFITTAGRMFHSTDFGMTWEVIETGYGGATFNISFADSLVGIFGGFDYINNSIGLYLTQDGGKTWTDIVPQDSVYLVTSVTMVPGTRVIVLVVRNSNLSGPFKTWASYDLGQTWVEIGLGDNAGWADFVDENTGFAGQWQDPNTKGQYYSYTGSPLLGLFGRQELAIDLHLGPNPAQDYAELSLEAPQPDVFLLQLHDAQGRLLHQETSAHGSTWRTRLDLEGLAAGMYSVTVSNAQGRLTRKLVKQ